MINDFRLADWLVQPELNTLVSRDGQAQRQEPKVMALLVCLAERAGEVVTKESLIQSVWADRFVSDEVLTTTMFELRKALGDEAKNPRFIQTVPRKGYRLIAPMTEAPVITPPLMATRRARVRPRWLAAGLAVLLALVATGWLSARHSVTEAEAAPIRSIAVLPLDPLMKDSEHETFACAMTEALRTRLAKLQTLRVVARTSVVPYQLAGKPTAEIARLLGVDALIEGAVLRNGNRVRVTAQFIHAASDEHLWAESYECELTDLLKVQDEIARAITEAVSANVALRAQAIARKETR